MSDSITIENSDGKSFAEVIDIVGVSEIKKSFQQSVEEGSLHKWFKGSKSKDGKPGWVNVVTGGTCASDKPGEGTPKCVSASKRASMTKAERLSAARRKKKADPGQQAKSGAAKPTYVSTDSPRKKKMKESYVANKKSDNMKEAVGAIAGGAAKTALTGLKVGGKVAKEVGKGAAYVGLRAANRVGKELVKATSGIDDNNADKEFDKVKVKRYKEVPVKESHYGSSVNKIPKELDKAVTLHSSQAKRLRASNEFKKDAGKAANKIPGQLDKAVTMHAKQAKTLRAAGVKETYSNWREEVKRDEYGDPIGGPKISKKQKAKNLASNTPDEQHNTRMGESTEYFNLPLEVEIPHTDATFKLGLMFRESLDVDKGMLFIFEEVGQHSFHMKNTRIPLDIAFVREDGIVESIKKLTPFSNLPVYSDGQVLFAIEANRGWFAENNVEVGDEIVLGEAKDKKGKGSGTKDACYHKVKSRYSVWPSAYASGALVKCRKVGAANWGNKSEEVVNELDTTTLHSYVTKASSDAVKTGVDAGIAGMAGKDKKRDKKLDKAYKRSRGINRAATKLAVRAIRKEETLPEAKYEAGASTYGKATIRNKRKFGTSGELPDPLTGKKITKDATRGELRAKRVEDHLGKRGVKTKGMREDFRSIYEGMYMGPDKKDLKQIKKMDNPDYAKKLADYEKNMDPKKRQALKDKATKGMKFTHEAFSDTGMAKGSGKPSGAMKDFLDKKAKKLEKERASQSQAARNNPAFDSTSPNSKDPAVARSRAEEVEVVTEVKDKKGKGSGTKDACYHKVKSRYSVWPSAYASGALVKCRKVGAANWGNKSESVEMKNYLDKKAKMLTKKRDAQSDAAKNNPHFDSTQPSPSGRNKYEEVEIGEAKKCWKGYKKVGTQKLFGKTYNRCEKEEFSNWRSEIEEGAAWTKKSGKNPEGGLNEKGRKSYERENPGSDLKAPSKKVGNKRRSSFCARMKGMKKKLTSAKTARDPDSRINKSLRKWNC